MQMTIRTKLIGLVGSVALVTVLVQMLIFPRQQTAGLETALESKATAMVQLAGAVLHASMVWGDTDKVMDDMNLVMEDKDVTYLVLFGEEEAPIAIGPKDLTSKVTLPTELKGVQATRPNDAILQVAVAIPVAGHATRYLVAGLDRSSISIGQAKVWRTAIGVGLVMILLALGVGMLLGQGLARRLAELATATAAMAEGDLSREVLGDKTDDEIGRLARSLEALVGTQRGLVSQITETAVQLNSAAGEFMATAQQQDRGATEQASAVEETRRTLDALIHSGHTIADSAQDVLQNAERTQQNSVVMAKHISTLSEQVQRITEILEVIKSIANKSELLALNAALEGTKAGEAGRGFSLVAGEMQRLAENVMEAVRDIRELTGQIRESTQASVLATEESTKLSGGTTRSSRQIAMIIQQQQSGTEQVAAAMDDVSKIATQSAGSAREIVSSTTDILQLCERLQSLVSSFRLERQDGGEAGNLGGHA